MHCPLIIGPTEREKERDRDGAERDEPCLSVTEDSCLDAAVSNGLPENMIPMEERGSSDG